MKRKPDDAASSPTSDGAAPTTAAAVGAAPSPPPPPPPTNDEEYKKSTKHFLYHCDVCNFTCQGPGIYYHIVSPKHKNLCQKQGRAFIEPKGVLVGSRGPARDRGTGDDFRSLAGDKQQQQQQHKSLEEDEVRERKRKRKSKRDSV